MPAIDNVISISITASTTAVATSSTTIPLLLGPTNPGWADGDVVHLYSSPESMLTDGFSTDDPEYKYAVVLAGQTSQDSVFLVGRRAGEKLATDDLVAIQAQSDVWYGLVLPGASDEDILVAAEWVQAQRKLLFVASATAAIADPKSTDDVLGKLKAKGYSRTALMFAPTQADQGIEAGWVGSQLPLTPGSNTWAYKTIAGVSAEAYTDAQQAAVIGVPVSEVEGKNGNIYQEIAGVSVTQMGQTADGTFIDQQIVVDWLFFQMQSRIMQQLASVAKVPMTDAGVALFSSIVHGVLDEGVVNGAIDETRGIEVVAAKVSSIPKSSRLRRVAPPIRFSCFLAGAAHSIKIEGNISV